MFVRLGLVALAIASFVHSCSWNNCPKWSEDEKIMNVHFIPHSHDDMGWIKTVDDYFTGRNRRLVPVGVENIFNTVIEELDRDPTKRFSFAEVGFLTRWLEGRPADSERVQLFKKLVQNGQIEFIGGGWVQPDEAAAHFIDIIDQYTLGLHKLLRDFGECGIPKVAWQIDPFGHSREHANIAAYALFHGRLHYAELAMRKKNKDLEFIWETSDDLKANLLTGAFYSNNYNTPQDFCFDALCQDDPIIDDPKLEGYNLPAMTAEFLQLLTNLTAVHRNKNHYLLSMGSDFHFSDASQNFNSLDRLVKAVNQQTNETNFNVFYSTPSCYVAAALGVKNPPKLSKKTEDFFPFASSSHSYWTGYFTSKPAMKRMVRSSSNFLQMARAMRVFANLTGGPLEDAEETLERAIGLAQHHDAITGTSKELVTVDYERRIQNGVDAVQKNMAEVLRTLHQDGPVSVEFCDRWNESVCAVIGNNSPLAITVFNGHSHELNTTLHLPFYSPNALVQDEQLKQLTSEISKHFHPPAQLPVEMHTAPYEIHFPATLPAFGFRTYFVSQLRSPLARPPLRRKIQRANDQPPSIENALVRLDFDQAGVLQKWTDKSEQKTFDFHQAFHFYTGWPDGGQPSGAYVFRPEKTQPIDFDAPTRVEVVKGKTFAEVRQVINPWISQRIRVEQDCPWVTFEFLVGPIPKEENNPVGKEVISRFNVSGLQSNGEFFTDSNGRQLMKRTINTSAEFLIEPIASNYYPITSTILIRDDTHQLTVLTDRSQGGGSFGDGNIDLMVHRRLFHDDHWGVDEALDEPGKDGRGLIVSGKHFVRLSARSAEYRTKAAEVYHEPVFAFTPVKNVEQFAHNRTTSFNGLLSSLPAEIRVLTLKLLPDGHVLLRLEHMLQVAEGGTAVDVDLKRLFAHLEVVAADELSLGANKRLKRLELERERIVSLQPTAIRTFELTVRPKHR